MNIMILPLIFIFGLIIGSFLNCLAWRLHAGESLLGRSYCPKCRKQIAWHDNIPLASFLLLSGKCRQCKRPISWQYPLVELAIGLLFVLAFKINLQHLFAGESTAYDFQAFTRLPFPVLVRMLRDLFIICVMAVIFIVDLRWFLIFDSVTIPSAAILFILNIILGMDWQNLLISGIIGGSFFLVQFLVSGGKWIGGGDIRLGFLMGVAFGWPLVIIAIIIGYWIGSIAALLLVITGKKQWGSKLPLGVFLSLSSVIVMLWGDGILRNYFNFFQ